MRSQPRGELLAVYLTRSYLENHMLLLVDSRANFVAIHYQEDFHGGMPRSFVPVEKWMVLDEGIAERRRFVHERGVQIFAPKGHLWLRERRLQGGQMHKPFCPTRLRHNLAMYLQDFAKGEVPHYANRL